MAKKKVTPSTPRGRQGGSRSKKAELTPAQRGAQTRAANKQAKLEAAAAQKRSEAARRGVETRKANAAARKRSEAAKRGAETRKANQQAAAAAAEKRSAAARNGAETKRANRQAARSGTIRTASDWDKLGPANWSGAVPTVFHAGAEYQSRSGTVKVEFAVRIRVPPGVTVTKEALNGLITEWATSGQSPQGVRVTRATWSHDGGRNLTARGEKLDAARADMLSRFMGGATWIN